MDIPLPDLLLAALIGLGIPLYAGSVRGRSYALFALAVLLFSLPAALVLRRAPAGQANEMLAGK